MQADKIIGIVKDIFSILGIIIGALWAYYNYFKGRIYRDRLELQIDGEIIESQKDIKYLLISYKLKNVGLSDVIINQDGSAVIIYSHDQASQVDKLKNIDWQPLTALPVFKNHQWIEPGEPIEEQQIINVPSKIVTLFYLNLRIISGKSKEWNAIKIILPKNLSGDNFTTIGGMERSEL